MLLGDNADSYIWVVAETELRRVAAVGHEPARVAARMRGEVVSDRYDR